MTTQTSPISGLPYPEFFRPFINNPEVAGMVYLTREEEVAAQARAFRETHGIKPASLDASENGGTVAVIPVDVQVGFCAPPDVQLGRTASGLDLPWTPSGGSLFVPGAPGDTYRGSKFILDNLQYISAVFPSLDTHRVYQIFHADFWRSTTTKAPPPAFTTMTVDTLGVVTGLHPDGSTDTYVTLFSRNLASAYCKTLADQGSPPLTIWPYHCRVGSTHHSLMPILSEVQMFHEVTRRADDGVDIKGYQAFTESYGIVGDEVGVIDGVVLGEEVRAGYIDKLVQYDVVVIWGEALSHCVRATVDQIKKHFAARDPDLVKKLYVLEDASSPVPAIPGFENDASSPLNFPAVAQAALAQWKAEGINVVRTTDNFLPAALR